MRDTYCNAFANYLSNVEKLNTAFPSLPRGLQVSRRTKEPPWKESGKSTVRKHQVRQVELFYPAISFSTTSEILNHRWFSGISTPNQIRIPKILFIFGFTGVRGQYWRLSLTISDPQHCGFKHFFECRYMIFATNPNSWPSYLEESKSTHSKAYQKSENIGQFYIVLVVFFATGIFLFWWSKFMTLTFS